mmetsp:Transcript_16013/g.62303  ORF Transcript_16013/g.62303 Transcript_16013/m.62303 type:complete len:138 (-) Transcript_16013:3641-4054(-)
MRDNLSRKVKLWNDKRGRNEYERLANLYALIRSVERLETAYVNSAAHAGAYEAACSELITKYKTLRNALVDAVPDVHRFMQVEDSPPAIFCNAHIDLLCGVTLFTGCASVFRISSRILSWRISMSARDVATHLALYK